MRLLVLLAALAVVSMASQAQWQIQDAHITADLRGIDYVGNGVAWASGSNGTVLRTEDLGFVWQLCTIPPGAEHLDFRGIQASDNNTAIVMSSGKGDLSRLYKTTDGCQTWKLIFTNPDKEGFWDAVQFTSTAHGYLLGDPVSTPGEAQPHFFVDETQDGGLHWNSWHNASSNLRATTGEGIFAASNSSMIADSDRIVFGTGGPQPHLITAWRHFPGVCDCTPTPTKEELDAIYSMSQIVPLASGEGAGVFSLGENNGHIVLVGGNYTTPGESAGTGAYRYHGIAAAATSPHGYRSAVAYDPKSNTWITVGPNGTDISTDDGRNWRALKPSPGDAPDADQHWNALSLPFVVGPHGRIGVLQPDALQKAAALPVVTPKASTTR